MPPKKGDQPKAAKVAIDKTFGMKNKKGGKGQKMVAKMQQEASQAGKSPAQIAKEKQREAESKAKAQEQAHKQQVAELFKPIQVQKVPFGVDPKSIVCQYYKAGHCDKGKKCKFSHDLDAGRKTEKKDLYTDARDQEKQKDTMDTWNDAKLQEVIMSKHGNPKTTTDIVCKFFIDAIEAGKYGWFWTCENGEDCKYVHALPPGFVLKAQKKKDKEDAANAPQITLEDFLETERHKLPATLTPLTVEGFARWKKNRLDKKTAAADAVAKAKQMTAEKGKASGLSGRDLFTYNPELYDNDDDDGGEDDEWDLATYRKQTEDERDEQERKRIEALGGSVAHLSVSESNGVAG